MSTKMSFWSYIIAILAISSLTIAKGNKGKGKINVIQYDVAGYYSYLPSLFIYKDIKKLDWRKEITKSRSIAGINDVAFTHESGGKVMKYSIGMAISYLPGFAAAHLYAINSDSLANGFSLPYQLGLILIGWLYMLIALWYLRKILSVYYEDWIVAATLLIVALGTNYYIYAGSQSMMSHAFLFMLYTLVIHNTIQWYDCKSYLRIAAIGLLIGLITITRPTEVLLTVVVLLWGVGNFNKLKARVQLLFEAKSYIVIAMIAAAMVISIQLIYWKYVSGDWVVYSYKNEGFSWDGRYLRQCFIGFRKGWLIYTPIMILGILGLYPLYKNQKTKDISKPLYLFLLINTYIVFSWDNYWYGGGFGQRAMISSYVLFAFPIAAWIYYISKKSTFIKSSTILFIVFCIWLNVFQTLQAQIWGGFETRHMTKKYYAKIFGKKNINYEWKVLLDNTDAIMGKVSKSELLYENNFEDSTGTNERQYLDTKTKKIEAKGTHVLLDEPISTLRKGQKIRAELMASGRTIVWNRFTMSNLHIQLLTDGKVITDQHVRMQDVARGTYWIPVKVDIKVRHNDIDQIKVLAWSSKEENYLFVDDLKVSLVE